MKVQKISTPKGTRYILLDDNYVPVNVVNRYLKYLDNIGKSPNTQRSYAYDLLLYLQYLQKKGVGILEIGTDSQKGPVEILGEFVLWLRYPDYANGIIHYDRESCARCNNSINHIISSVLELYRFLANNNEIQQLDVYRMQINNGKFKSFLYELVKRKTTVMSSIFKQPVESKPVEAITREQYNQIFLNCKNRRDKLLVSILFEAGLRINEALGIHICDLANIEDKELRIVARENNENGSRVKGYAEGVVYLPNYVIDILLNYINNDILEYDSDYLFINLYGKNKGYPLRDNNIEQLFTRISNNVGFKVTPHMLRHGFAQEKIESGWELYEVQSYLRHKNPTSTEIYAKFTDSLKLKKMQEFEQIHDFTKEAEKLGRSSIELSN